ncbi:MAG: ATP-binding protein, partial [Terracidiphilus sp.]
TLFASDRGSVWIGSTTADNESLFCELSRDQSRKCLPLKSRVPVTAAYSARDGALWIANDDGIWRYTNNKLQSVDRPPELKSGHYVQAFAEDRQGGMWVSFGRLGLYRYAAGVWTRNGGHSELPALTLTEYTDSSGFVWFGCINNNLGVLEGDHVRVFAAKNGIHVGNITAITGRGSEVWVGGEKGIQWVQDGHIHDVFAVNRGWLEGISGIVATSDGDLWLNGLSGITHIPSREVAAAMADPAHKMTGQHYGEIEGAPGGANQVRPLETAVESTDGRIWFSGSKGYRWIDPRTAVQIAAPPPVSITSLVADRKSYELGRPLALPASTSEVRISFAGVSLSDPAAIRFRYKLQETDDAWHESETATPVTYQNLSPGTYHFSANSSDSSGAWSGNIATQVFTILPSWYQTGSFRLLWIVSACLLLILIYRVRVRSIARAMSVRFDERLDERTRMARELHDTFLQTVQGSKMVADDALASGTDEERMLRALEKLSGWLGQAVSEGRTALHALRVSTTEKNELAEFLERTVKEQCHDPNLSVATTVVGDARNLHPIVRDEVSLIAREAIHNACTHSRASQLRVELGYAEDLRLCIRDNGIGIDPNVLDAGKTGHFGLRGMRERSARIRAKLTVSSSRNHGTEVVLKIPGDVAYLSEKRNRIARYTALVGKWISKPGRGSSE